MLISDTGGNAGLDAMAALLNGGSLRLLTGAAPAISAAETGTAVSTHTLANPAFAASASKRITLNAVSAVLASASGTPTYARLKTSAAAQIFQLQVGGSWVTNFVNGTDTLTTNVAHGLAADTPVEVFADTGGVLPTGLAAETTYYARTPAGSTLQLAATPGGAAVNFTTDGSGTLRLKLAATEVALASADGSVAAGVTVPVVSVSIRFP
jgi:hypothetical protein